MAMRRGVSLRCCCLFLFLLLIENAYGNPNYREALAKSLLFFQGQRSGRLPKDQQITWRSNSGLSDGLFAHVCFFISWISPPFFLSERYEYNFKYSLSLNELLNVLDFVVSMSCY